MLGLNEAFCGNQGSLCVIHTPLLYMCSITPFPGQEYYRGGTLWSKRQTLPVCGPGGGPGGEDLSTGKPDSQVRKKILASHVISMNVTAFLCMFGRASLGRHNDCTE